MTTSLSSEKHIARDFEEAQELAYRSGWSDGLPIVPPVESLVRRFLDSNRYEPEEIIAVITERDRTITAEKAAINTVMAGCLPEYFPVVVATLQAMTAPRYKFNHLASLGSPWPIMIVNGPITKAIGLHSGIYAFGPGHRANMTIARAVSLVLRNCGGAKVEDVQRGQWGNSIRLVACVAENEETEWTPLHVQRGFDPESSAVTVASTYPGSPAHVTVALNGERPDRMLKAVCHTIANWGGAQWTKGTYVLMIGPHMVEMFVRAGWSKDDVRDYVVENTKSSIASLKYRGAWGKYMGEVPDEMMEIEPGDEDRMLSIFKPNEEDSFLFLQSATEARDLEVLVMVAGGDAGGRMQITIPYQVSTNSVTKEISIRS